MPGRKGKGYRRGFEIFSDDIRPDLWRKFFYNYSAKVFFRERNEEIYENYIGGIGIHELAHRFSLSEKSIQRILRNQRLALSKGAPSV